MTAGHRTSRSDRPTDVLFVSHTHWDREWYRTFEGFRARLVDAVDRILDLLQDDPGWCFHLDGQSIVVEDYLTIRPGRRGAFERAVTAGRLAVGPWYVQPDSLLPSGEAHVRNLLEGRQVARSVGGCSQVAYTPDSFGHPAQFPQLFAGFGLGPFVYWRGNGDEIDDLGPVYRWEAPDGSTVTAYHLSRGYSCAAGLAEDPATAAVELAGVLDRLGPVDRGVVVLMNGVDHMLPDTHTAEVAEQLSRLTGRKVTRGLLDGLIGMLDAEDRPTFTGELAGGRVANLLPGVWSARMSLKLANHRAEQSLIVWAEPWAALGRVAGLPDERPALRTARRALLANQAHDSIGGCSQDEVHRQMAARFATATELADQTTSRVLERLAGLGPERRVPWSTELDLAVFNPTPYPRTDVVRFGLDGYPVFRISDEAEDVHPLVIASGLVEGYTVDGRPVRVIPSSDPGRMRVLDVWPELDVEFVAHDIPPFGWRRFHLAPSGNHPDVVDDGHVISADGVSVAAADDGTLTVQVGSRSFSGLGALEDLGDRGDTYDFDPVPGDPGARLLAVGITRHRHPSGIEELRVTRTLEVPEGLTEDRARRADEVVTLTVVLRARVAPGVEHVDLHVEMDNTVRDHRLRMLFPTGSPTTSFRAATTFGVATRSTTPPDASRWQHPAPATFPHHGWVEANGLRVAAPGLPEGEVMADGTIAVTLLRSVGWLARLDLTVRPIPAGPSLPTPDAQCPGSFVADLRLAADRPGTVRGATAPGLRAVPAGAVPLLAPDTPLLALEPELVELTCLKPAEDGDDLVLRVLNPTDEPVRTIITPGFPVTSVTSVRLDESPDGADVDLRDGHISLMIGPRALRTIRLGVGR